MNLSAETARQIVNEEHDDWQEEECKLEDSSRWDLHYCAIHKHLPSNKFYRFYYTRGATEMQYSKPYESDNEITVSEVRKVKQVREVWLVR